MEQTDKVRESILGAIQQAKYNMPDGTRRVAVYNKLLEALLWYDSESALEDVE